MNTNQPPSQDEMSIQSSTNEADLQLKVETAQKAVGSLQLFGIHPGCAALTVIVDSLLFGGTVLTAGVGWIASIPVGLVLGGIVTIFQKRSYNDDWLLAAGKGLTIALLTAIPTPIASVVTAVGGVLGGIQKVNNLLNKPKQIQANIVETADGREVVYVQESPKTSKALWIVIALLMILVAALAVRMFI